MQLDAIIYFMISSDIHIGFVPPQGIPPSSFGRGSTIKKLDTRFGWNLASREKL